MPTKVKQLDILTLTLNINTIGNVVYGKNGNLLFGKAYTTEFMNGFIDDIRIYYRALYSNEVEILYNE
jgi:hypothetical protein